jgi:hypothetical protein
MNDYDITSKRGREILKYLDEISMEFWYTSYHESKKSMIN